MHLVDRIRAAAARFSRRLALVGADPRDDDDLRARKALLVLISVLILPVAALWGALYLALGSPVGVVPLVYFGVLLGAIAVFSRTRDFPWFLRVGQVSILLAPTLSMIPLGGFVESGGVGLWGILAPLAALVFSDVASRSAGTSRTSSCSSGQGSRARSWARSGRRCPTGSRAQCWP